MTASYRKSLQTKLDNKLIALVKPSYMSNDEYKIACNMEFVDPTVKNGSYLHWLMTADEGEDTTFKTKEKVHALIVNALKKKYLLDIDNADQCSYFCDGIVDNVMKDRRFVEQLLEAIFEAYPGTELFNYCWRLNRAFGFTSKYYFSKEHESLVDIVKTVVNGKD